MATIYDKARDYADTLRTSTIIRKSVGQHQTLRDSVLFVFKDIDQLSYETDHQKLTPNDINELLTAIDENLGIRPGTMDLVQKSIQGAIEFENALAILKAEIEASQR